MIWRRLGASAAVVAVAVTLGAHFLDSPLLAFGLGIGLVCWLAAREAYFWRWDVDLGPESVTLRWRGSTRTFAFRDLCRAEIHPPRLGLLLPLTLRTPGLRAEGPLMVRPAIPLGWGRGDCLRRLLTLSSEILLQSRSGDWVCFPKKAMATPAWMDLMTALLTACGDDAGFNQFRPDKEKASRAIDLELVASRSFVERRWSEAAAQFAEASAVWREIGHMNAVKRCLFHLAEAHLRLGDLGAAAGFGASALSLARRIGERHDVAHGLLQMGELHLRLGGREDLLRSRELLDECLQIYANDGDRFMQVRLLNNRAIAEERLYEITRDEAWLHAFKSDAEKAWSLFPKRPRAGFERIYTAQKANVKGMLARSEFHLAHWSRASTLFAEAAEISATVTFSEDRAMWGRSLVRMSLRSDNQVRDPQGVNKGLHEIDSAVRTSRQSGQFSELVDVLSVRADTYWELGNLRASLDDYETAILLLEGRYYHFASQFERASSIRLHRRLYQRVVEGLLRLGIEEGDRDGILQDKAFWYSELSKARTLSQRLDLVGALSPLIDRELRDGYEGALRDLTEARMNLEYLQKTGAASGEERLEAWRHLQECSRAVHEMIEKVRLVSSDTPAATLMAAPSRSLVRSWLPASEGAAVLAFSIGETALCGFFVSNRNGLEGLSFLLPGLGRQGLEDRFLKDGFLKDYEDYVELREDPDSASRREQAYRRFVDDLPDAITRIREVIIEAPLRCTGHGVDDNRSAPSPASLQEILERSRLQRLVIVPDGLLHRLPIHACFEQIPEVTSCPSSAALIHSVRRFRRRASAALIVANPAHGSGQASRSFGVEAEIVAQTLQARNIPCQVLSEGRATGEEILESLSRVSLFHFAGHAESDFSNPAESHLKVAPDGARLSVGRLISQGRLADGSWVVLSACETGISSIDPSGEYLGLSAAFIASGSSFVISTLWEVHDLTPLVMMEEFYLGLAAESSPQLAFQKAWQTLRAASWSDVVNNPRIGRRITRLTPLGADLGKEIPPSHPFHWAAFVTYGACWTAEEVEREDFTAAAETMDVPTVIQPRGDGFPERLSEVATGMNRLLEEGNPRRAVELGEEARKEFGSHLLIDELLAFSHLKCNHLEAARESFERVLAADPNSFLSHYNYGCLLRDWGLPEASEHFQRSLDRNPWSADTLKNLSELTNDLPTAVELLKRARELGADQAGVFEALDALRPLMSLSPGELAKHRLIWASEEFVRGDFGYAKLHGTLALELREHLDGETLAMVLAVLSDVERQRENWADSVRFAEEAANLDPGQPARWNTLAARRILLVTKGQSADPEHDLVQAEADCRKAIAAGDYAKPHRNLGTVLWSRAQIELGRVSLNDIKVEYNRAHQMALRQNQVGPGGELVCTGCPSGGTMPDECRKCLADTGGSLREISLVQGSYSIEESNEESQETRFDRHGAPEKVRAWRFDSGGEPPSLQWISPKARRWRRQSRFSAEMIRRAAVLQARNYRVRSIEEESRRLAAIYDLKSVPPDWSKFGDLALHLTAAWPPDLAYLVLYSLRSAVDGDVVPPVLKAVELLPHFQPHPSRLKALGDDPGVLGLALDPSRRAQAAARLLCREISCVPLPFASAIFRWMDEVTRVHVRAEMKRYNPAGMRVLDNGRPYWLLTPKGFWVSASKAVFGGLQGARD